MPFWMLLLFAVLAVSTLMLLFRRETDARRTPSIPCLMYHRFVTQDEYDRCRGTERIYSISVGLFESQLARLRELGYHFVSLREAVDFARGRDSLPLPAVAITIDDGCRSVATRAAPILRRFGCRATVFVTTDPGAYVFQTGGAEQQRMSDAELVSLEREVFEVGAHGHTHRPLTTLPDEELAIELQTCRERLERVTGRPVAFLAIPGGWYDARVARAAREAGFEAVAVSEAGAIQPGTDAMRLPRLNVSGKDSIDTFVRNLSPASIARRRLAAAITRLPGRFLGPRRWMRARRILRQGPLGDLLGGRAVIGTLLGLALLAGWALARWMGGRG